MDQPVYVNAKQDIMGKNANSSLLFSLIIPSYLISSQNREDLCKLRNYECLNGGTCIDTGDQIKCVCHYGFSGDMCEIAENACKSEPCIHGRCENKGFYHVCQCDKGWSGPKCDELEKVSNIGIDCNATNTLEVLNYNTTK